MIIDCHAHLVPQSWFHPKSPKSIFDLPGLFEEQDKAALDITVFGTLLLIHPPKLTIGNEKMEVFRLPEMLGRPFDTTLSLTRFIFTGGFERFPKLKMVCAHGGGALAMLPGRYGV